MTAPLAQYSLPLIGRLLAVMNGRKALTDDANEEELRMTGDILECRTMEQRSRRRSRTTGSTENGGEAMVETRGPHLSSGIEPTRAWKHRNSSLQPQILNPPTTTSRQSWRKPCSHRAAACSSSLAG